MYADITHDVANISITPESKGFERMVSDYHDYRNGYQYETFNVKDDYPESLQGMQLKYDFDTFHISPLFRL